MVLSIILLNIFGTLRNLGRNLEFPRSVSSREINATCYHAESYPTWWTLPKKSWNIWTIKDILMQSLKTLTHEHTSRCMSSRWCKGSYLITFWARTSIIVFIFASVLVFFCEDVSVRCARGPFSHSFKNVSTDWSVFFGAAALNVTERFQTGYEYLSTRQSNRRIHTPITNAGAA